MNTVQIDEKHACELLLEWLPVQYGGGIGGTGISKDNVGAFGGWVKKGKGRTGEGLSF